MKRTTKILASALALALVACISVAGTLAYLTSTTNAVVNTFTVGNIKIDLNEWKLKDDGTLDRETPVKKNDYARIVPGAELLKEPFVTVDGKSENCWVYVCVDNGFGDKATINVDTANWQKVGESVGNKTVYRYKEIVNYSETAQNLPAVFTSVKVDDVDNATLATLNGKQIVIAAYAHQSAGITDTATIDGTATTWLLANTVNTNVETSTTPLSN